MASRRVERGQRWASGVAAEALARAPKVKPFRGFWRLVVTWESARRAWVQFDANLGVNLGRPMMWFGLSLAVVGTAFAAALSPSIPSIASVEGPEIRKFLTLLFGLEAGLLVLPIAVGSLIVSRVMAQDPEGETGTHGVLVDSMLWPVLIVMVVIMGVEGAILVVDFADPSNWISVRGPQNLVIWSGLWFLTTLVLLFISVGRLFKIVASPQPSVAYKERARAGRRTGRASQLALLTERAVDRVFDRAERNRAVLKHPDVES